MAERDARKTSPLGMAAGALAFVLLLGITGLVVVYTGAYNVAATEEHTALVRWAFDTTFRNSVERRAPAPEAPAAITPEMLAAGASAYKSTCQHCHSGPGVERASWASGMRPRPPHLAETAKHWELSEVFWIAKHGVKMTGMPAFGPSHDDRTLWGIAAFVKQLPAMTPEEFAALGEARGHQSAAGGTSGHAR
ncbi:MAG TPA: cytochrome c [Burkholderiales bacterium]|nr:cytochrome c [Burkholderiales bacterium]